MCVFVVVVAFQKKNVLLSHIFPAYSKTHKSYLYVLKLFNSGIRNSKNELGGVHCRTAIADFLSIIL